MALFAAAGVINTKTERQKVMKILEMGDFETNFSNGRKCPFSIIFFYIISLLS